MAAAEGAAARALLLAALALAAPWAAAQAQGQFLLSQAQFEQLFPERIAFYTYEGFAQAVRQTPAFAARGSEQQKRQEMAAFLGQIAHESDQLKAQREYRRANWDKYCREQLPGERCAPGQQYYGRGPIQLSWNYQYKAAGEALGLDLWADPDRVARDSTVAWQTALWYWTTQPGVAPQSSHEAMLAGKGFGATTRAINGVIECDQGADPDTLRKLNRRIDFYRRASSLLEVPLSEPLGC
ncbi:chitinase [Paucibacter sp. DJ2R-2]|uniref:chitinase n=1 Tax=Paucibacter sp. DJ2R-2 TaxID=2893558 RepID=UPI0021E4C02A|nr:chitinase [Paucibacter sp. DJ2R-2]MCV2419082.1 chitinase [Paucibacter sp. DJ4R-1]MCV2437963.1 chitinase [Paucibacter sp. DJ2R-2]